MQNIHLVLLLAAGMAVTGCGAGADQAVNAAAGADGARATETVSALPDLRSGLWRTTMIEGEVPDGDEPEDNCVGPGENLATSLGVKEGNQCSKREIRRAGDRYVFDIACSSAHANMTVQGNLGGDFTTNVTGDLTLGLGVPGQKIETKRYRYASRYVGTCTPQAED